MEYEFSVEFRGRMLSLVSAPAGATVEDVAACARRAHLKKYTRVCSEVRLAEADERPDAWISNPLNLKSADLWLLVVVYELGFPEVCDE